MQTIVASPRGSIWWPFLLDYAITLKDKREENNIMDQSRRRSAERKDEMVASVSSLPQSLKRNFRETGLMERPLPGAISHRHGDKSALAIGVDGPAALRSLSEDFSHKLDKEKSKREQLAKTVRSISDTVIEDRKRLQLAEEDLAELRHDNKKAKKANTVLSQEIKEVKASQSEQDLKLKSLQEQVSQLAKQESAPLNQLSPVKTGPGPSTKQGECSHSKRKWFSGVNVQNLPPVSDELVVEFIPGMAGCWDRVGVGLGVGEKVKCVRHSPGEAESKCLEVVQHWIECGKDVTWNKLLDVLEGQDLTPLTLRIEQKIKSINSEL